MFPPSLHKNIRELDKQISLLECECENMESEKRKKTVGTKIFFPKSKESVNYVKTSAVKGRPLIERPFVTGPRFGNSNLFQKSSVATPVTKIISKNSLVSKDIKKKPTANSEVSTVSGDEVNTYNKTNFLSCRINRSTREKNYSAIKKDRKTHCIKSKELDEYERDVNLYESDIKRKESESENENQILHKGILHANPGGTIEVTVTQKTNKPHNNALKSFNCKIPNSSRNQTDEINNSESLFVNKNSPVLSNKPVSKIKTRNQKWSEILCLESDNIMNNKRGNKMKNDASSNCSLTSKTIDQPDSKQEVLDKDVTTKIKNASLNEYEGEIFKEFWDNENKVSDPSLLLSGPRQQGQTSPVRKKNLENAIDKSPDIKTFEEKEVQCIIKNDESERPLKTVTPCDIMIFLCTLIETLKNKFAGDENKRLLNELDNCLQLVCGDKGDGMNMLEQNSANNVADFCDGENIDYMKKLQKNFWTTKKSYEDLIKERNQLLEDLAVKEQLLKNANGKEKEYLTEITDLRVCLEREKIQAKEKEEILRELNSLKDKFTSETKISNALRKSHGKMQEQFHKCTLENDKLKTQIRMSKLESQKFCVLLAGKDAEIRRYREEVQSFQRQISEQLAALRCNAATFEVQKAMEAIIQHSQAISQSDLESVASDSQTEENPAHRAPRHREMVHSSPTSSKSSALDTSWNHISSIRDHNTALESNSNGAENEANAGSLANLGNAGDASPSDDDDDDDDDSRETGNKDLSFISCRSLEDLAPSGDGDGKRSSCLAAKQRLRKDIEVLFRDIKAQCSRRKFSIPGDNFKLDPDLLNSSGTSVFSEVSGKQ